MTSPDPPFWAEQILRMSLAPAHRETLSGDLLELYRERSIDRDAWYVNEVAHVVWLQNRLWMSLLAGSMLTRTIVDWFVPTTDFHSRAAWSTVLGVSIAMIAGFVAGWRSRSIGSAAFAAFATFAAAACAHTVGVVALITLWHSPETLDAIRHSGGLWEAATLPLIMCIPGAFLGGVGGTLAKVLRALA